MRITPLYDRGVIRRLDAETTHRGIVILDSAVGTPNRSKVLATGVGALLDGGETRPLTVGNRVLFASTAGIDTKLNGETYPIVRESKIHAVIEDAQTQEKAA
ncbi:co-chaperone GroES [Marinobacter caseinilyticus]|uniref:co-chaperone GroES n=1 Tax=Marinobacter caseinilyticus TaxID=2692195 RepID=UPI00140A265C|nr:co-chaperone GroES [Marinobacter caseinilyticus]